MHSHWSTHQLTEYLVALSRPHDGAAAIMVALEQAIETLDAELGVVLVDGQVRASLGFGPTGVPENFAKTAHDGTVVVLERLGEVHLAHGDLAKVDAHSRSSVARLVIGRSSEGFSAPEVQMLHAMALILGLVLDNLKTLQAERSRHQLVETLLSIQRSISARRPLPELLDAVTTGAADLLGGCPVALLLTERHNAGALVPASTHNYQDLDATTMAIVEEVMAHPDCAGQETVSGLRREVLAERVVVGGEAVGCLVARPNATDPHRRDHGHLLSAFAQQVSLALTDARTLDEVREASHDPITGLPNRKLFLDRLERGRRDALAHGDQLTVLFIDLDRFKAVNDTLGHTAGDDLLAEVARRITACLRPDDTAARVGGDEFSVLLGQAGVDIGQAVAGRIITALGRTFIIAGREVIIGASVGIAALTTTHQDSAGLLSDADVAMYCAKRSGRGRSLVFEPQMHEEVVHHLTVRTDLQHAHLDGQLWMAYQPLVRMDSHRIEGVEALMRWDHPVRGTVSPADFIPIAEESQAIISLGEWALHHGTRQVGTWREHTPDLRLSLNVSTRQIVDPSLPRALAEALEGTDFPPEALTLEITESLLMKDPDAARRHLLELKKLGVQLSVDDFGTGYSSLSCLRQFPVDEVKIDRSFVTDLNPGADDDIAIVRGILDLCRGLRLRTVAEGIERQEQFDILADLGCDLGQGYFLARPMRSQDWPAYRAGHPLGVLC